MHIPLCVMLSINNHTQDYVIFKDWSIFIFILPGIVGYFPIHPYTLVEAKRITRRREELEQKLKEKYLEEKEEETDKIVQDESDQSGEEVKSESVDIDHSPSTDNQTKTVKSDVTNPEEALSESITIAKKASVLKIWNLCLSILIFRHKIHSGIVLRVYDPQPQIYFFFAIKILFILQTL